MWEQLGNRLMQKGEKAVGECTRVLKWVCMRACALQANSKANKGGASAK